MAKLCQGSTGALETPHLLTVTYARLHNLYSRQSFGLHSAKVPLQVEVGDNTVDIPDSTSLGVYATRMCMQPDGLQQAVHSRHACIFGFDSPSFPGKALPLSTTISHSAAWWICRCDFTPKPFVSWIPRARIHLRLSTAAFGTKYVPLPL